MNFHETQCQRASPTARSFGICAGDDNGVVVAYDAPKTWIAAVENSKELPLVLVAIDKCVTKNNEYRGRGRCDAMLTSPRHLYFIELKEKMQTKSGDAKERLESTINFFKTYHPDKLKNYRYKKAFICSKKHDRFQVIDNEVQSRFYHKHGFRLDIQAQIIIV